MRMEVSTARRRFAAARVARLATSDVENVPHLVPVTFALDGDDVVSAVDAKPKTTTTLRRIRNVLANPRASLLVDHYDEDWSRLWWVRVDGHAAVADVDEPATAALVAKYPQYRHQRPHGPVLRVRVTTVRGWAASSNPPTPTPTPGQGRSAGPGFPPLPETGPGQPTQ